MVRLISLLTDFGTLDPFVGEMKAVICSVCPDAKVIDISHAVEKFNIRMGSFLLMSSTRYFPEGTVHLAVVDPGVGSKRRPIAVETNRSLYVGPDNGLLIPAAISEGIRNVYELSNRALMGSVISSTFHGRDIFAPVAAHLACGTPPGEVGMEVRDYVHLSFGKPEFFRREIHCVVLHVDGFGNIVTNIPHESMNRLSSHLTVTSHRRKFRVRSAGTYSDLNLRQIGLLVGSHGFLEFACREASAAERLNARVGEELRIRMS